MFIAINRFVFLVRPPGGFGVGALLLEEFALVGRSLVEEDGVCTVYVKDAFQMVCLVLEDDGGVAPYRVGFLSVGVDVVVRDNDTV